MVLEQAGIKFYYLKLRDIHTAILPRCNSGKETKKSQKGLPVRSPFLIKSLLVISELENRKGKNFLF
jgi:hypothetical protein